MTLLDRVKSFQELWTLAMPVECGLPPDSTFIGWLGRYSDDEVQGAIIRTARKMFKKLRDGVPVGKTDADRYCSAVLSSKYRRSQESNPPAQSGSQGEHVL